MKTNKALLLLFFITIFSVSLLSQSKNTIKGNIKDTDGNPQPFVNIFLLNTRDGTMSDEKGYFIFTTKEKGTFNLRASLIGFKKYTKEISLDKNGSMSLEIILEKESITMNETVITASSFSSEKAKGLVLRSADILMTPGGAADIYQSLKTMPGATQVSESAELYIRGGDPTETITLIDQATMYHPFTYESSYGSLFSNIDLGCIKGMYFSSGGFSAKYGNTLSGVLDIQTKNEPENPQYNIGASIANVDISGETPILRNLGLRYKFIHNFNEPLFWLNGSSSRIVNTPVSNEEYISLSYRYSENGRIKVFGLLSNDEQGVNLSRAEYKGNFYGESRNNFWNVQITDIIWNVILKNSFSFNTYRNHWTMGIMNIEKQDEIYKYRSDFEYNISGTKKISAGIEAEHRISTFLGVLPDQSYNLSLTAKGKNIDAEITNSRYGGYSELEVTRVIGIDNVSASLGLRIDYFPGINIKWIDPRLNLVYKLSSNSNIKFGAGVYHQAPDPRLFSPVDGNPNLLALRADHFILSFDHSFNSEDNIRIEFYHKNYANLPLKNDLLNYDNNGHGFASGIDIIIKGALPLDITGWVSYGYINTKRIWMDFTEWSNSTYDITHNLALILKYDISKSLQTGINYKHATGRPYTPVINSIFHSDQSIYEPVYGKKNSDRFPSYNRLDIRFTYFHQLFERYFTAFYLEALNILNIKNIFDYTYNENYTKKTEIESYFGRRIIVFGFQLSL